MGVGVHESSPSLSITCWASWRRWRGLCLPGYELTIRSFPSPAGAQPPRRSKARNAAGRASSERSCHAKAREGGRARATEGGRPFLAEVDGPALTAKCPSTDGERVEGGSARQRHRRRGRRQRGLRLGQELAGRGVWLQEAQLQAGARVANPPARGLLRQEHSWRGTACSSDTLFKHVFTQTAYSRRIHVTDSPGKSQETAAPQFPHLENSGRCAGRRAWRRPHGFTRPEGPSVRGLDLFLEPSALGK